MHAIGFDIKPSKVSNDHQVRIIVDGRDLIERLEDDMLGIDPPEFFASDALLESGELTFARCGCGVIHCGSATVNSIREDSVVVWDQFCPKINSIKSLIFSQSQFDSAVEAAKNNHEWEPIERTAERLIGNLDFSALRKYDLEFSWASGRIDAQYVSICLSLNSQYQVIVHVPWDHANAEAALEITRTELAKPPSKWSNVIFYPLHVNLGLPKGAGPGWRQG